MPVYKCPRCGRIVEKPYGQYYCSACGPTALMYVVSEEKPTEEITRRFIRGVIGAGGRLGEDLKRYIRESLVYALNTSVRDVTERRIVVEEFYAALNRRNVLTNVETEEETKKALEMIAGPA